MHEESDDPIERTIGRFGRYQAFITFLVLLGRYPIDFQLTNVVFILPRQEYVCLDEGAFNLSNHCPCQYPQYDQSTIVNSVTSEWNLICENTSLASLSQSIMQVGILPGSLIFGAISDRYGRKTSYILANLLTDASVLASSLLPQFWMFMCARFLIGAAVGGVMLSSFVYEMELCGKSFRPYLTALHEISYISGYFMLPVIAYFVREWRYLQMVTSVPWFLIIVYIWLLPESPRWLITVGKTKKAIETLSYIAKKNNRSTTKITAIVEEIQNQNEQHERTGSGSLTDLFKTPKIRVYSIVMSLIWMCCAHTHYGAVQYVGRLKGNIYINVMVSALSHIPGLILTMLAALFLKRRVTVLTCFSVSTVAFLLFIAVPEDMPALDKFFAMLGQTGAFAGFLSLYLFTTEIFPTEIRNSAMGFASLFARFGSFLAPFVVNIGVEWISILIFCSASICAALLSYFLPETKDIVLLNTIEETELSHDASKGTAEEN